MCGRFALIADWQEISDEFGIRNNVVLKPRYNICPGTPILVLRDLENVEFMEWGLRPAWLKQGQNSFTNARSETLLEKPAFKRAFQRQRCLIICSGYFEWKQVGRIKQPYFMHFAHKKIFAMAGVWEGNSCAIITRLAPQGIDIVHQRMPVIINNENDYNLWLNPHATQSNLLQCMQQDVPGLIYYSVSTRVNNPVNDVLECILPLQ